ncbi:hypothetical protein D3C73_1356030 [compost metagenome]
MCFVARKIEHAFGHHDQFVIQQNPAQVNPVGRRGDEFACDLQIDRHIYDQLKSNHTHVPFF